MSETIREQRGRLVREAWVTWAREHPAPKSGWLTGWDELDEMQREVDMRIGEAVAAAERERIRQLAIHYHATWSRPCDADDQHLGLHTHHLSPFADLIADPQ